MFHLGLLLVLISISFNFIVNFVAVSSYCVCGYHMLVQNIDVNIHVNTVLRNIKKNLLLKLS